MRCFIYYMVFPLLLCCWGCNDWLDVSPRTEMKQDDLYDSEEGFRTALIGVYIKMAETGLYGKNTSYYFPEYLARTWSIKDDGTNYPEETALGKWNFEEQRVKNRIAQLWKDYYNAIVQLNNILENIDRYNIPFNPDTYHVLKGEAFGLRAFLHLDILRFFGPEPLKASPSDDAIPYVTEMTTATEKLLTLPYGKVLECLKNDLDSAQFHLEKKEPLLYATNPQLNYRYNPPFKEGEQKPLDEWFYYRQRRFNLYAVMGTKARFYHWTGDRENAVKYAKAVIESGKFRLSTGKDMSGGADDYPANLIMMSEQLFGIHNLSLQNIIQGPFLSSNPIFTQTTEAISSAYEGYNNDERYGNNRYWETIAYDDRTVNHFRKYGGNSTFSTTYEIPLLRLAEMYLILMEDLPFSEITPYWSALIDSRNLSVSWLVLTEQELPERLEKEYRKEFMGEGQMVFFYKRHGYTEYTWPEKYVLPEKALILPKPDKQTVWDDGIIK